MKKTTLFAAAAILSVMSTASHAADAPASEKEKCYGIAKAGKNDCAWSGGSCAGSTKADSEKAAWLLLPKGVCGKIAAGTTEQPK